MSIVVDDIVTLRPLVNDIREAEHYAIKSGVPYTYNRMNKDAWRRVARIARGKVNESLIRHFTESLGIQSTAQDKNYRQHDAFDFTFNGKYGQVKADVKTFHILSQFVQAPRAPFSAEALLSDVDHTFPQWHLFFPMLVPQDYKQHKDVYVFAVSVEAMPNPTTQAAFAYPWVAFPDGETERFVADADAIRAREEDGKVLDVTVAWPTGMPGAGNVVYERRGTAWQMALPLSSVSHVKVTNLASFLAIRLDDVAKNYLQQQRETMTLTVRSEHKRAVTSRFEARRFREVFPRQDFALYLIGWIGRHNFERVSRPLSSGAPCYFYPPRRGAQDNHVPGTKTANRYVLPSALNPITTLTEV